MTTTNSNIKAEVSQHKSNVYSINTVKSSSNQKIIRCFCNDDSLCPPKQIYSQTSISSSLSNKNIQKIQTINDDSNVDINSSKYEYLNNFLNKTQMKFRYCSTNTVCLTKRLTKLNGEQWLKYYCDQAISNSIRGQVIEYRDCRINTPNQDDKKYVMKSMAEYCCDEKEFCNVDLKPDLAVKDISDFVANKQLLHQQNNLYHESEFDPIFNSKNISYYPHINNNNDMSVLNPINLALSFCLFGVFLFAVFLFICYKYKKLISKSGVMNRNTSRSSSSNDDECILTDKKFHHHHLNFKSADSSSSSSAATSPCSPYSTSTTSSTASTSITSKESSNSYHINHIDHQSVLDSAKQKIYNDVVTIKQNSVNKELFEPLLNPKVTSNCPNVVTISSSASAPPLSSVMMLPQCNPVQQMNPIDYFSNYISKQPQDIITINSPLSTTQSSGFACTTTNGSSETAVSPSEFEWSGSGSGAGFPQCVQRTIARQIKLIYPCIGKGRFGEVYKGEWRGEYVAVKTFNSADEKSWENECNIYNTPGFRNENILGFIASDNIDRGLYTELWLITEFHEKGSLYDYLTLNTISTSELVKMALSIVNGLVHLHMPIESCNGKPALAHCDLKSKNILVKSDLSCCIGDLGLALSGDKDGKITQVGNIRTGTKRYMAPEILSKRIDTRYLDAFQKAEMYSLALIFWELLNSCKFEDETTSTFYSFEYKQPYYEYISDDPDEHLMRQIVCEQKLRPGINSLWQKSRIMSEITSLTEELWVENPNERLNALRLKKSISKIKSKYLN